MKKLLVILSILSLSFSSYSHEINTTSENGCQEAYTKNIARFTSVTGFRDEGGSMLLGAYLGSEIIGGTTGLIVGALGTPLLIYGGIMTIEKILDNAKARGLSILDYADFELGNKAIPTPHTDDEYQKLLPIPDKKSITKKERRQIKKQNKAIKRHNKKLARENKEIAEWLELAKSQFDELLANLIKKDVKVNRDQLLATIANLNQKKVFCDTESAIKTFDSLLTSKLTTSSIKSYKKLKRKVVKMVKKSQIASDKKIEKVLKRYITIKNM
jgi:hypothetical protein